MRVVDLPSTFYELSKRSLQQLTPEAQERLRWVNCCQTLRDRGMWASAAAEVSNLSRWTLYRWAKALREEGPVGLLTKSRRPRRVRRPRWNPELAQAVLELRERHPRWGKDKLVLLLRRRGLVGLNLYDGSHSAESQGPRCPERTAASRHLDP